MQISVDALAGTLESSDVLVKMSPHSTLDVTIASTVMAQFGDKIREVVDETLTKAGVESGLIIVEDKGALDCTIRARLQAAIERGTGAELDWSAL